MFYQRVHGQNKKLDFVVSFFCNEQRITGRDVSRWEGSFEALRRRAPDQGMPQRDAYGGFLKWGDPQTMGCNTKIV